jgi:hypothetical protein
LGVDVYTIAFNESQLAILRDVTTSDTVERVQQLLSEDPTAMTLGPYTADEANVRTFKTRAMAHFPF